MADSEIVERLLRETQRLARELASVDAGPRVTHTYNTLEYAYAPHEQYLRRFAGEPKQTLFLGMNPGPWGMAQTGVPFGDVVSVRDWMGIDARVGQPPGVHPKRPVRGFACTRREISGKRLWGLMRERFGTPEAFFQDHFVLNYCPLLFIEAEGTNRTPDKLPREAKDRIFAVCDAYAGIVLRLLRPKALIGVGRFALERLERLRETEYGDAAVISSIPHPSPANPQANRDWAGQVTSRMEQLGLWHPAAGHSGSPEESEA